MLAEATATGMAQSTRVCGWPKPQVCSTLNVERPGFWRSKSRCEYLCALNIPYYVKIAVDLLVHLLDKMLSCYGFSRAYASGTIGLRRQVRRFAISLVEVGNHRFTLRILELEDSRNSYSIVKNHNFSFTEQLPNAITFWHIHLQTRVIVHGPPHQNSAGGYYIRPILTVRVTVPGPRLCNNRSPRGYLKAFACFSSSWSL